MSTNDHIMIFRQCDISNNSEFQAISLKKGQLLTQKIEMAMKQKGFNRQQFASIMNVQPSIITRWLSGNHNFTVETLFEIEEKLGVQLIAIEKPIYNNMYFHMTVGSEPIEDLNSSLVQGLYGILQQVIYCNDDNPKFADDSLDNSNLIEFFKFHVK